MLQKLLQESHLPDDQLPATQQDTAVKTIPTSASPLRSRCECVGPSNGKAKFTETKKRPGRSMVLSFTSFKSITMSTVALIIFFATFATAQLEKFSKTRISTAFDKIKEKLDSLTLGDVLIALNDPIPLVGKSVNQLLSEEVEGGSTIVDVLDFASNLDFLTKGEYTSADADLLEAEITGRLQELLGTTNDPQIKTGGACGTSTKAIGATFQGAQLTIQFCSRLEFERTAALSDKDMFTDFEGTVDIDFAAALTVSAGLDFEATLTIGDGASNPTLQATVQPLQIDLNVDAPASLDVTFGLLEASVDTTIIASASFSVDPNICENCGDVTGVILLPISENNPNKFVKYIPTGDYSIKGKPSLTSSIGNLDFGNAQLLISDTEIFDKKPPTIVLPGFQEFIDSIVSFSPSNAIGVLRALDNMLTRFHDSELVEVNIPLTNKKIAEIITTGSVLLSRQLKLFQRVPTKLERPSQSLLYSGTFDAKDTKILPKDKDGNVNVNTFQLSFLVLKATDTNFLDKNLDDFDGLFEDFGIEKCQISIDTSSTTEPSSTKFANNLFQGINGCGGLTACLAPQVNCDQNVSNKDFSSNCQDTTSNNAPVTCDVYIGINSKKDPTDATKTEDTVFIATTDSENLDFHLIGLFELEASLIKGVNSLYGIPLNDPVVGRSATMHELCPS